MKNEQTKNRWPWLNKTEYPFKANFLKLQMGQMHYVDEGKGDPIVFVHGNPGWSFEYRKQIKALSTTNRCIAPDHIGFGLSDKPYEWDYLPKNHAANFEVLMDSLKLTNITLVVADWGGPIGLSYALKNPEKIDKLIIMNSFMWSAADNKGARAFSNFLGGPFGIFLSKYFNFFARFVSKQVVHDKSKLSKVAHQHMYKHLSSPKDRKGTWVFPKQIIASSDWMDSLWKQRSAIENIPTTILWGMKDPAFPPDGLVPFESFLKNFKIVKLDNVGHYPQEEAAEILIKVLEKGQLN